MKRHKYKYCNSKTHNKDFCCNCKEKIAIIKRIQGMLRGVLEWLQMWENSKGK